MEIISSIFPGFKKKPAAYQFRNQGHFQQSNSRQPQESFEIPKEEEPPSIESRAPTPKKVYPFMSKDAEKLQHQLRQSQVFYSGWNGEFPQQQQQQQQQQLQQQKHQHRHQHHSSMPQTYYEQSSEKTNEIVFGAIQEEGRRDSVIRPTDYAMHAQFNHQNIRLRTAYNQGYPYYT